MVSFQTMIVLVVTPCSLRGGYHVLPPYPCPTLKIQTACFSETLIPTVNATRYPIPEAQSGYPISLVLSLTSVKPLTSSSFRQAYTNPRRQVAVASNFLWRRLIFVVPYYGSGSCQSSGSQNFEVAPACMENLCTPGLTL